MTSKVQAHDPCPEMPAGFADPTRLTQLAREWKTKKAAAVADRPASPVVTSADTPSEPELVEQVLAAAAPPQRWTPPAVATKDLTASRQLWAAFGPQVAAQAWRLSCYQAERRAFFGEGADNNWALWRQQGSLTALD